MNLIRRAAMIATCCAAVAACRSGTADDEEDAGCGIGTAALTGVSVHADSHAVLAGAPFAVAVSSGNVAYISRIGSGDVVEVRLPNLAFSTNMAVGYVPTMVAFNPSGTLGFVTNQLSQNVGVIDVASHAQVATIPVNGDPFGVVVSPDNGSVYVTTNRDELLRIHVGTRTITGHLYMPSGSLGMAACRSLLYISTHDGGVVSEIETKTNKLLRTFRVGGAPQKIVISPTGTELYVANEHGMVQFWDVVNNVSLGTVVISGAGYGLAQSPGDGRLYVTTLNGQVQVIDPVTRTKVDSFVVGGVVRDIAFNSTGTIGVVANESGWVDFLH